VASDCSCFASQARTKVTLQQVTLTDDGIGGKVKSWTDYRSVWAIVQAVPDWRRLEVFQAQKVQPRIQQKVTIRYIGAIADNAVAAAMRVIIGSRTMNVSGIQNLHDDMKTEGKAFQALYCVEGEAA
jgi:SPP1 family predicted phage head-tail adaptor